MSGEVSEVNKSRINKVNSVQKALTETINRINFIDFNVINRKNKFSPNDRKKYYIKFNDSDYIFQSPWFDNTKQSIDVIRQKIRINFESTDLLSNNNKIFLEGIKNVSKKIKSSIEILPFTYYKILKDPESTKKDIGSKDSCYLDFIWIRQHYNNYQIPVYFESTNINNEYKIDRVLVDDDDHMEAIIRKSSKIKFDFLFGIDKHPFWWNNLSRKKNDHGIINLIKSEDMWKHTDYHEGIFVKAIYVKLKSPPFDEFFIKNFGKQKHTPSAPLYNKLIDIEDENNLKGSTDTQLINLRSLPTYLLKESTDTQLINLRSLPTYKESINIENENNLNESVDTQSGAVQVFDVSTLPVADVYMIAEAHRINDD